MENTSGEELKISFNSKLAISPKRIDKEQVTKESYEASLARG